MPKAAFNATRRYAAFLSYRHADNREEGRRWAEWLHQALETYEVPHDLAGRPNQRGTPVPASLYPVFRDEEELPADADLSQNIRRALENSDLLIILCSPRACQSRFVAEEIRYFKELGKSERILALMIDGEPNADDPAKAAQGITPELECLPEPLRFGVPTTVAVAANGSEPSVTAPPPIDWTRRAEPIAADVRPQNRPAQGYTSAAAYRTALEKAHAHSTSEIRRLEKAYAAQLDLARLKLVAGALGVPLGQLRERDAVYRARKFRRLAALLGSLALLALLAAGVAVWQRTEANQQKLRAEVGEKNALAAKERAVASKKAADELIEFMQYDLHDTLGKLGHLDMMAGIHARIQRYHREHPLEAGDQAAQNQAERERAVALQQQGDNQEDRGQLAAALQSYRESLAILRKLVALNSQNTDWQRDLSMSFEKIGVVQQAQGDLPAALQSHRESLAILQKLTVQDPRNTDWQRDLSISFNKDGDVQETQGDLAAALQSYRESLAIRRKLAAQEPQNAQWQHDLAGNFNKVGSAQEAQGDLPAALQSYRECLAIVQKLTVQDAEHADWQHDVAASFSNIGDVQQAQRDLPAALQSYRDSLAIAQKLAARDTQNAVWQHDLSVSFRKVGDVQQAQGNPPAALQSYRESSAIAEKLALKDPANADWQRDLSVSFNKVGDVQETQGDLAAALQSYRESLAIRRKLAAQDPQNAQWQLDLAYSERNIGVILLRQAQLLEARHCFERYCQIVDRLAAEHPGNYRVETGRAHARWILADCVDQQTPAGREEARRLLAKAAAILHELEQSPGLQPVQTRWLRSIETDLAALK